MWHYGISYSEHCNKDNNYNDDNVIHVSVWFESFGVVFECQNPWYVGRKHDNKEWASNWGPVYTMDHEVIPWEMALFHGPTFMVRFLEKPIYKPFGPLTRCKLNVGREEQPCTKKWMCHFFNICPKRVVFQKNNIKFDYYVVFSCLHFLCPPQKEIEK